MKKDKLFGFLCHRARTGEPSTCRIGHIPMSELSSGAADRTSQQQPAADHSASLSTRPATTARMDWTINNKNSAYVSYSSQANNSLNDQSDGTRRSDNGNFTVNHLQLANFTLNSLLSNSTVNQFTVGFQYWNNLIASNIMRAAGHFPERRRSAPTPTFRSSRSSANGSSRTTSPRRSASIR